MTLTPIEGHRHTVLQYPQTSTQSAGKHALRLALILQQSLQDEVRQNHHTIRYTVSNRTERISPRAMPTL